MTVRRDRNLVCPNYCREIAIVSLIMLLVFTIGHGFAEASHVEKDEVIQLRAWGVPTGYEIGPEAEANRQIMDAFRKEYPWINPVSSVGLFIPGGARTLDMVPMMQIAGDIAPDILNVILRFSGTYIDLGLLYPLDEYVEELAGVRIKDGHRLATAEYIERLTEGPGWQQIEDRVPPQCWNVIRRQSPDGAGYHIYAFPVERLVLSMQYDKLLMAEHADQGVEVRAPRDWEEMLRWAKIMTDPAQGHYGFEVAISNSSWAFANFLYSAGGKIVEQDSDGNWYCVMDSEHAVEAAHFWARLRLEKVMRDGTEVCRGVLRVSEAAETSASGAIRHAMRLNYLDDRFLKGAENQTSGFGPLPAGPSGLRRAEFNARMLGIFSGLAKNKRRRDAAWSYIQFYDGTQARRIRVEKMVEAGLGQFMRRKLLDRFNQDGRYDSVIRRISPDLEQAYRIAFAGGVPEPYGKNCLPVYDQMRPSLEAIWSNDDIRDAIDAGDEAKSKQIIRDILRRGTKQINQKMLGILPPEQVRQRNFVSWIVIVVVLGSFLIVLRVVFRAFTPEHSAEQGGWQFHKYWKAYAIAAPALFSIGLWTYWPMIKGTAIAFQDYSVLGASTWVGASNFSEVLYNSEFWYSLKVSLIYALLFLVFGFFTPVALAFLLSEVPRGKIVFRTVYYLPAVLSGVVVIFLWKSFYSPDGMINQVLNSMVWVVNMIPGLELGNFDGDWLQNPTFALFFCLLPTVWAGMGPGCLIYLAALKTIPDELYEAADIDGAAISQKLFHVAIPTIKILIMINFIGAMIGAIRGSGGFILAMTGGGPYTEAGGATEVIGLKLFYTTFGYLRFGVGAAMAWVIGAMLLGFTVWQLKRLSNVEFRAAGVK